MDSKSCCECKLRKPLTEFHRRGEGHQAICKTCRRRDDRDRYDLDSVRHGDVRRRRRLWLGEWAFEYKRDKPCTDCGVSFHPAAMQWDHIGDDKEMNVSDAVRHGRSKERILAEIAKCELVCANCHAVRTYERRTQEADDLIVL